MGEPNANHSALSVSEYIGDLKGTGRTETS